MLLKVLHITVRGMFYVFVTWNRFAPDGSGKGSRIPVQPDGPSDPAKRVA